MTGAEFTCGGIELVEEIKDMWERLTQHASERSVDFAEHYASRSFDQRRKELRSRAERGRLRIDIAREPGSGQDLGYCVSTVDADGLGTIESLFIHEGERRQGVGDHLVRRSREWFREQGVKSIVVFLVYGNEEVLPFYYHHGFRPKAMMLEIKE
jgi:GNAT superfamily N-acetyltransferase